MRITITIDNSTFPTVPEGRCRICGGIFPKAALHYDTVTEFYRCDDCLKEREEDLRKVEEIAKNWHNRIFPA